jgi:hypothetical protein
MKKTKMVEAEEETEEKKISENGFQQEHSGTAKQ